MKINVHIKHVNPRYLTVFLAFFLLQFDVSCWENIRIGAIIKSGKFALLNQHPDGT